jgi:hypothetical protein
MSKSEVKKDLGRVLRAINKAGILPKLINLASYQPR